MKKNKRARQEGALQRLQTACCVDSKGWQQLQRLEAKRNIGEHEPDDAWITHDTNWCIRRDDEIAILKKRLNIA